MSGYTNEFGEVNAPLAAIDPVSLSGQSVSSWVSLAHYPRAVAVIQVGAIAGGRQVIARIEQAKDTNGTDQKVIAGKETDALLAADQNGIVRIELRAEELDVSNKYDCVALKITTQGGAVVVAGVLYGTGGTRYAPVPATLWDVVLD